MLKDTSGDFFTFLIAVFFGIALCILFDVIKAFRKSIKHSKQMIFIEDIAFSIVASLLTYLLLFLRVYGEIRWFVFFGELTGFILSRTFLTKHTTKLFLIINKIINKIIFSPLKKIFSKISSFLNNTLNNFFEKIEKTIKKTLKHMCLLVYNKRKYAKQKTDEVDD